MDTVARVRAVFQEHFGQDLLDRFEQQTVTFEPATTNRRVELDSLDQVEFVMALEDEFKIEITDDIAERMTTIPTIVHEVDTMVRQQHPEKVDG
ncbi:phosphopantetheine-binding protein [Sphingomonas tagetis]|uniref:phosphopantetheine-binding protein n=1 Tax=Sphingomonas tagetis TaxID=2949092 RepID=UPI00265DD4AB|nr:phosphopantetheine-binding protein [Sphingomonas tagetis]